jgi:hypothetical protein
MIANDTASSGTGGAELSSGDPATQGRSQSRLTTRSRSEPLPSSMVRSSASNSARARSRSPCANTGPSIASHPAGATYDGCSVTSARTAATVFPGSRASPARTYSSGACAPHSSTGRLDRCSQASFGNPRRNATTPAASAPTSAVSGRRPNAFDTATAAGARPSDTSARTWATTASASEPPRRSTSMMCCSCSVASATADGFWPGFGAPRSPLREASCSESRSPVSRIAARRRPGGRWRRASSRTRLGMGTPRGLGARPHRGSRPLQ